jgi:hypothetical protein
VTAEPLLTAEVLCPRHVDIGLSGFRQPDIANPLVRAVLVVASNPES